MRNPLILILLISFGFNFNHSMELWKDKNYNFLDYADLNFEDKCVDSEICQNFEELIKRKPKSNDDALFKTGTKKESRLAPVYHSSPQLSCSCGIDFKVLDLGHLYYPRYVHSGVCKSEMCGGLYRCTERHYKVRVLKQKEPKTDLKSLIFPENLKSVWQPETVSVTVACECAL